MRLEWGPNCDLEYGIKKKPTYTALKFWLEICRVRYTITTLFKLGHVVFIGFIY